MKNDIDPDNQILQTSAQKNEEHALRWSLYGGFLAGLSALLLFGILKLTLVPIQDNISISTIGGGIILVVTFFAYGIVYWQTTSPLISFSQARAIRYIGLWRDTIFLSIAHSLIAAAIALIVGYIFSIAFKGLALDQVSAAIVVGVAVGLSVYITVNLARTVNPDQLIGVLAVVLIGGTFFSMVTNANANWWRHNFSYLGTQSSSNAVVFNLTFTLAAFIMLSLSSFMFRVLEQKIGKDKISQSNIARAGFMKGIFIATAIALAGVGVFPFKENTLSGDLHNISAFALLVVLLLAIALLKWIIPALSQEFFTISYLVAGSLILCYILYRYIPYLSNTAFEFLGFSIGFGWLLLFLRQVSLLTEIES